MSYLLALTFILAPDYVIKFSLLGLPTNLLMVWVVLVWLIFIGWLIIKNRLVEFWEFVRSLDKKLLMLIGLFFLSGIISLFVGGINRANLGQFIVLFLQPMSLFFIAGYIFRQPKAKGLLLATCYLLLSLAGILAIVQYFTLWGLPPMWWGNSVEPKRALGFFAHPNFYALWCAPLLAILLPDLGLKLKDLGRNWPWITLWILGSLGLLLSFSRAGWLGLAVAALVYLIVAANKKTRLTILVGAVIAVCFIFYYPNLRLRVTSPFYGEKSASSRVELWESGLRAVKQSPIFGLGLNGYANKYRSLQTDNSLADHNFPHNIFLNFWVETGFLGLISFLGIASLFIYRSLKSTVIPDPDPGSKNIDSRFRGNDIWKLSIGLFLIALITQGLIDNPYFKNDLALIFWLVLALAI